MRVLGVGVGFGRCCIVFRRVVRCVRPCMGFRVCGWFAWWLGSFAWWFCWGFIVAFLGCLSGFVSGRGGRIGVYL